jgi:hypothetical protein
MMVNDPTNTFDVSEVVDAEVARKIKLAAGVPLVTLVPAAAAAFEPALVTKPGKERWPVKTGTDKDVDEVGKNIINGAALGPGIVDTTIAELVRIPRKPEMQPPTQSFPAFQDRRSDPVETTIWRVEADIIELKMEGDGDYHLVLQGQSGETMIAESPNPSFVPIPPDAPKDSPWLDNMKVVRQEIEDKLVSSLPAASFMPVGSMLLPIAAMSQSPRPEATFTVQPATAEAAGAGAAMAFKTKIKNVQARVTGVGFFDRVHGQDGVAQANGIELHPILKIELKPA